MKASESSKEFLSEDFLSVLAFQGGSPSPVKAFTIDDVTWVNNITDLTGRIVKVTKDENGNELYDLYTNITYDTVESKVVTPSNPQIDTKYYSKEKSANLSVFGISGELEDKTIYEYSSITTSFARIVDRQIQKSKVPGFAKCSDLTKCEYYYINAATIQTTTLLILRSTSKKAKVQDLPSPAAVLQIQGSYYSGIRNEQKNVKNILFCTLVRIPI